MIPVRNGSGSDSVLVEPQEMVNPLTVTIERGTPPTGGVLTDTYTLTVTFSRPVNAFTGGVVETFSSDAENNARHTLSSTDSTIYTITITPPHDSQGTIRYRIPANSAAAQDDGVTGPTSEASLDVNYDVRVPRIIRADRGATGVATVEAEDITLLWNVGVRGFANADISDTWSDSQMQTGLFAVTHTDGQAQSTIRLTYPQNSAGTVVLRIARNAVERSVAPNREGPREVYEIRISYNTTQATEVVDDIPPVMQISQPFTDPWRLRGLLLEFQASEVIRGFTQSDIELSDTNVSITEFTNVNEGSILWRVRFDLPVGNDSFTITVPAMSFEDVAGNENVAEATRTINYDTRATATTVTGTNVVEICKETYAFDASNPYRSNGIFMGVLEGEKIGDDIYLIAQLARKREGSNEIAYQTQGSGALVKVDVSAKTCTVLDTFPSILLSPRSLTEHNNALHMFFFSHYAAIINPSPNDRSKGNAQVKQLVNDKIETLSLATRYRNRLSVEEGAEIGLGSGMATPMLSHNNELHFVSGYDSLWTLDNNDDDVSRYNNFHWQQLSSRLNRRLPFVETNGVVGWDIVKDIAILTDSIIGFDVEGFFMKPRSTQTAQLAETISGTGDKTTIKYRGKNREFPAEGYIVIDDEVFLYDSNDGFTFSGVTRAWGGTDMQSHMEGQGIHFVSETLSLSDSMLHPPIDDIDISLSPEHYNVIKLRYGQDFDNAFDEQVAEKVNERSLKVHPENDLDRNVPLSIHEKTLADWVATKLRDRYGHVRYRVNLELKLTLYANVGDYLFLLQKEKAFLSNVVQVVDLSHNIGTQTTNMVVETI